ncbi:MAG: type VI secretion system tip protein TssI/VgrG [Pseudomonadota bacterium]
MTTELGANALVLLRMDGAEELSGDFEWRVEALSDQAGLDLHALLGTHATVEIAHADGSRAFDGIVCEAEARGAHENGFRYDLILRPWLHIPGLRRNMAIFHNKTVIQIVEEVLGAYAHLGKPHLDIQVADDYPELEYTVQYGESDADFARRQLERHGISWLWRHEPGNHTLVLTDKPHSLPEIPGSRRPYYSVGGFHQHEEEHFSLWSSGKRITTGAVRLTEYNFKTPNAAQEVDNLGDATHPSGDVESYDWPGDYLNQGQGGVSVAKRLETERGQASRHHAEGDVVSLGAGWRVKLAGDEVPDATGKTFICLKAQHRFRAQAYGSGDAGGSEAPYTGAYVLMPDTTPYRPERRTVGPRVQGPETAVVVGDGEIDCDEYGRILCRFHWDLEAAHTMRVRVSQNWASKGWGGMVIPRIGMEVIIEHLRGDPDKPIVTGCVYNGKNGVPYPLPEHKTRSTFRSDTHQGDGFNELRFEDERGKEEIYLHAEKDLHEAIENDHAKFVGGSSFAVVDGLKHETVQVSKSTLTGVSETRNVGRSYTLNVGEGAGNAIAFSMGARKAKERFAPLKTLMMSRTAVLPPGYYRTVDGENAVSVTGSSSEGVDGAKTISAGTFLSLASDKAMSLSADTDMTLATERRQILTAGKEMILRCGKAEIKMTSDGQVFISGTKIFLN